ncbi:MAG TPA: hypothetical protein VKW78_00405 [Terriglobales bacterium]|nr:hypothetical protein [Terriglobales bacterium]
MKQIAPVATTVHSGGFQAAEKKLSGLVQRCPACHKPWTKHRIALLGTRLAGVNQFKATEEFFRAVKGHNWQFLEELHEHNHQRNSLEAYALGCPEGGLHILVVRSPFELHVGNEMLICEPVAESERSRIEALIAKSYSRTS